MHAYVRISAAALLGALAIPATVSAQTAPPASARAVSEVSNRSSREPVASERLVDSYCSGGYCERVYRRLDAGSLQRPSRNAGNRRVNYNPFVVRIERDPDYGTLARQ